MIRETAALAELENVSCYFRGVHALDGVSMTVRNGTVHGLIGPNGAGKTTLINVLTGFYRPTGGRVLLDGKRLDRDRPFRIARRGVARTFQNIRLFGSLSAIDNVLVARRHGALPRTLGRLVFWPTALSHERRERETARLALEQMGVHAGDRQLAGTLSYGDQRRVEIARALATEPRLLLLDEPAAGMNREERDRLGSTIRGLLRPDRAILLIEHDLPLIMAICDYVTVLNFGRVIAAGSPSDVARDPAVIEAYLGRDDDLEGA
jgi:ABC-type branched-subunit amino acid transport system ATPase component